MWYSALVSLVYLVANHMAITRSAKKALRASARKKAFNDRRKRAMRAALKAMRADG